MAQDSAKSEPVGVVGLGLLGSALCERLLDGGFDCRVYNRSREKAEPLITRGAVWSDNPLAECDRAVICLYTTEVVEEVLAAMDSGLRSGQILVDATTGNPNQTEALGKRLAERGVHYLESPIAASSEQTRRGEALAMVAGPRVAFDACEDIFACIAPKTRYIGDWGNAAKMKLVNNLVLGLNRVALAEGLLFAREMGLDMGQALEVLKVSNSYSVVMDVKGRKMVEGDFSLQAKLSQHAKDIRIVLEEGTRVGLPLPLSHLHLALLEAAEAAGWGEMDNSVIIRAVEQGLAKPNVQ